MDGISRMTEKRIVRQLNNNLLKFITEYVGLELCLITIVKINSYFKAFVKHIYHFQLNHLSEYKKILFKLDRKNVKETLSLFNSFYKNEDQNWHFTTKFMSHLLFKIISNG
jgi:hypothetical protein